MYSNKQSVLQLTALLRAHGVRYVVVCAGSRSSPLAHTLAACPDIDAHPCVDERSGAFEALGYIQATGKPAAVCVTSGTALLDAAPAVAEAFYQELPLVVLSADRPPAWIDQLDGQTMRQVGALANYVKRSVSLPLGGIQPPDMAEGNPASPASPAEKARVAREQEELWHLNCLVNEALLECVSGTPGPVHINVPLTEPLFSFDAPDLPEARVIERHEGKGLELPDEAMETWLAAQRPLVIFGQTRPGEVTAEDVACLSSCVVVSEHLGNARDLFAENRRVVFCERADLAVFGEEENIGALRPDLVITLGGHVVSKRLKRFLRGQEKLAHWHVSANGSCPDVFQSLTKVFCAKAGDFLRALPKRADRPGPFLEAWREAEKKANERVATTPEEAFTDVRAFGRFLGHMPENAGLHLGNSSPLRNAQYFSLPRGTRVFCNRGVNGIDGSLSAALGNAKALPDIPIFCCIGDLSFFYDQNALWRETLPNNLHILLFANGEGNIFRTLPGLESPYKRSHISGTNRFTAREVARNAGFAWWPAKTFAELEAILPEFCQSRESGILEVFTDPAKNADELTRLSRPL